MMNSFVLRSLTYVDDDWITEAQKIDEQMQVKIVIKNKQRRQYFYGGLCIAAIVCAVTFSLIWSFMKKGNENLPLESIETEIESTEEISTPEREENITETDSYSSLFHINRDFTSITYGYADNKLQVNDIASRNLICSTIESIPMDIATEEELASYQEIIGQYLLEFDNGVSCAMTTDYFYYSDSRDQGGTHLYRFKSSDSFYKICEVIERIMKEQE